MMLRRIALILMATAVLLTSGCASNDTDGPGRDDPSVRVQKLLQQWQAVRDKGGSCASGGRRSPYVDCGRIQAEIERLVVDFPTHPDVLLANAVIAFETNQSEKAQDYLDALIRQPETMPGVVVLRSRLALRDGNLPYARRLLSEQIQLSPDSAELREALAAAEYLAGEFDEARRQLRVAERLGAPAWRVAFNRGLLAEAEGDSQGAMEYYRATIEANPEFEAARSRLVGLESEGEW